MFPVSPWHILTALPITVCSTASRSNVDRAIDWITS
jgi:hypothetical protein